MLIFESNIKSSLEPVYKLFYWTLKTTFLKILSIKSLKTQHQMSLLYYSIIYSVYNVLNALVIYYNVTLHLAQMIINRKSKSNVNIHKSKNYFFRLKQ